MAKQLLQFLKEDNKVHHDLHLMLHHKYANYGELS